MIISPRKLRVLRIVAVSCITFFGMLLLGAAIATYLPGIDLNDWLHKTANYWLIWRLGLYILVVMLVYRIHLHRPLSPKAICLIALSLFVIEALNLLYRL